MPFNAEGKWIPEDQSAAKQLNGLLASDSKYIKQARFSGERTAASRGLQNSSMAAGASEAAAVAAAAPIASQDAAQIAGQNQIYQQGNISKDLQTADLKSRSDLQTADLQSRSDLQTADFGNQQLLQGRDLASREGLLGLELDSRASLQDKDLTSREQLLKTELANRDKQQLADIASRYGLQEMSNQNSVTLQGMSNQNSLTLQGMSNQNSQLLQGMSDAAANLRQKLQIEGSLTAQERSDLAAMERQIEQLSSQERQALLSSETQLRGQKIAADSNLSSNYLSALGTLSSNPDISAADRNAYIQEFQRVTNQGRQYTTSIGSVNLDWGNGTTQTSPASTTPGSTNPTAPQPFTTPAPTNPFAKRAEAIGINFNGGGAAGGITGGLMTSSGGSLATGDANISGGGYKLSPEELGLEFVNGKWQVKQ